MNDADKPRGANDDLPAPVHVDPATAAFERLREEVALTRRAVAGLAVERTAIVIPDYSETLGQILLANTATTNRLREISEAPALQSTVSTWGREIAAASETARRHDHAALSDAQTALQDATESLRGWIDSARQADRQNRWLIAVGAVGLVIGIILGAVVTTRLTSAAPTRSGTPEQQAAASLHMTEEKAGEHLIQIAAPALWSDLVLGDRIVIANRDALARCQYLANEHHRKAERCMIEVPAYPGTR